MTTFSDYLEGKVLDHVFGGPDYTRPATLYFALYTVAPNNETGSGGTEVSGGSYARPAVTNNSTNFPSANPKVNGTAINFATPTADWGACVYCGILDAASGGNLLGGGTITKTINNGDTVSIPAGSLSITLN